MNGSVSSAEEMEEDEGGDGGGGDKGKQMVVEREKAVLMWGYLPGVSPQRSPLMYPTEVLMPEPLAAGQGDRWRDVCGGGCGFAVAISDQGKLLTWGATSDMGQSYLTSGKHEETPEPFPLEAEVSIVNADAGWAHCVAVTDRGKVYTWGWKECVPTGRVVGDQNTISNPGKDEKDENHNSSASRIVGTVPISESRGEESSKKRKISSTKQGTETSTSSDETLTAAPCIVSLNPSVKITSVSAGARHTLALSDVGQVWGWGYGGEGQLGLGSRIRLVSSPHPVPCISSNAFMKDTSSMTMKRASSSEEQSHKVTGSFVKAIACGGRHSAVVTETGTVLTFGWGLYGQCGQESTEDELSPTLVSSLLGVKIRGVAAGLWHTVCVSDDGAVYSFGGNQFGQLGTGACQAETLPKLLEAPCLEDKNARIVSCGARHTAIVSEEGQVFCWGWNKYGQLGLGDAIDRSLPTQVPLGSWRPLNVSCGWWHTLLLAESIT